MRISLYLGIAACLAGMGVVLHGAILSSRDAGFTQPNPEIVSVTDSGFASDYFDLSYRAPDGWAEGLPGPAPSPSGYYVLGNWAPKGDFAGTILVVAQDMFFEPDSSDDVKSAVSQFRQVMSKVDGMTIDREPTEVSVAGRPGYRVDFSGVGLFRSMFAIEIRCHVVMFNLTSRDAELLASLAGSLDNLVPARKTSDPVPECVRDYASDNVVHRVEPHAVGTRSVSVPVRVIVAADGSVKHVHVIHASAAQQRNIEDAVRQWKFKPYASQGHPVEVETGMVFNLKPASM
jgi:TonB family protein